MTEKENHSPDEECIPNRIVSDSEGVRTSQHSNHKYNPQISEELKK